MRAFSILIALAQEHPQWNIDNISQPKTERTLINKAPEKPEPAPEASADDMNTFWKKHSKDMKHFGMLSKHEESKKFLLEHPELVCDHMASYLAIWCIDLCVEEVKIVLLFR